MWRRRKEAASTAAASLPPWHNASGTKRVVLEYRNLQTLIENNASPVHDLSLASQDDASRWRFKMRDFNSDTEGGRNLNEDLARLDKEHGCDHLLLEVWVVPPNIFLPAQPQSQRARTAPPPYPRVGFVAKAALVIGIVSDGLP